MLFSAALKSKARAVLKGHWQTALLIALIVNLPMLLVQGLSAFTGNDLTARLQDLLVEASYDTAVSTDRLLSDAASLLQEPGILTMLGLSLIAWLITPCLALGMNHWALSRLRGQELPVSTVFSRLPIFLKGIGLRLLITLKILLWMLPGIAVSLCSLIPLFSVRTLTKEAVLSAMNTSILLIYAGMFVMMVLGVIGYLRYVLADLILADEPEERIRACTRRSREMMTGRKGAFLSLLLSFLLWYLLVLIVTSFAAGMFGTVLALMLQMLGSLILNVYVLLSECAFYEAVQFRPMSETPSDIPDIPDLN